LLHYVNFYKNYDVSFVLRLILLCSVSISVILLSAALAQYCVYFNYTAVAQLFSDSPVFFFNRKFFNLSLDFFGMVICFLAFFVAFLSFLSLDTRLYLKNNRFIIMCNLMSLIVYLFVSSPDIFILFFFYECLLIPSALFVYFVSPYRRAVQAAIYFLV